MKGKDIKARGELGGFFLYEERVAVFAAIALFAVLIETGFDLL